MAQRKFKKILIIPRELPGCRKVCGLEQPFFGGPGIFAEFKFSLRNGSMKNYCFRWRRRVATREHACVAFFPNLQGKKRLEQKSSQIPFLKKCELPTILAAGFQQLLFIPFTHRAKAEEQKIEDRVLRVSWRESKNYTECK